jgi:hypothetical protein
LLLEWVFIILACSSLLEVSWCSLVVLDNN